MPHKPTDESPIFSETADSTGSAPATGSAPSPGRVTLVGAGPGDPGLITVAGLEALRGADVVVYDALANPILLEQLKPDAVRVDAGKRAKAHKLTQDQIHDVMLEHARAGRDVVRLKGGDPYLFGRGAEEMQFLAERGVAVTMIPGVTSGVAAPATAGIPVTHREHSSVVAFVTGHEDPSKTDTSVDYAALARLVATGGTVCLYMAMGRLPAIAAAMTGAGLDADTPAAAVQWGTLPVQRQVRGTLTTLHDRATAEGVGAPAIVVIGAVAGLDAPGLDAFTRRPLFGRRIVVTRTRQQASSLREKLAALGAAVLEAPTIAIEPPPDPAAARDAIRRVLLDRPGVRRPWLVLTSVNGVHAFAEALDAMGLDARALAHVRVAAIGAPTAEAVRRALGVQADLVPARYVAEALADAIIEREAEPDQPGLSGRPVLLYRAEIARPALPRRLGEAGADVHEIAAYRTTRPDALPDDVAEALARGEAHWVTFTSSSTVDGFFDLWGTDRWPDGLKAASIGPITSDTLRRRGVTPAAEAERSDIDGLVEAIVAAERNNSADA